MGSRVTQVIFKEDWAVTVEMNQMMGVRIREVKKETTAICQGDRALQKG